MKLVWHMVAKDLRRMALPTALWLALIVGPALWFVWGAISGRILGSANVGNWSLDVFSWTEAVGIIAFILAYVLVGTCVLEDPLVGTTAFWQTRPVANSRLLAAKVVAVLILFVVAPGLVLLPVQLATGISLGAALEAIPIGFQLWFIPALIAAAVASLTRTLGRFLFASVVVVVACLACGRLELGATQPALAIRNSRDLVLEFGLLAGAGVILLHQFLVRRTTRSVLLAGALLVGGFATRQAWPWDFWTPHHRREIAARLDAGRTDAALEFEVHQAPSDVSLAVFPADSEVQTSPVTADRIYVPTLMSAEFGPTATARGEFVWVEGSSIVSAETAASLVLNRPLTSATWHFRRGYVDRTRSPYGVPLRSATLRLWRARVRVVGELPITVGAAIGSGFDATRVIGVEPQRDGKCQVVLRETQAVGNPYGGSNERDWNSDHRDVYLLVNRSSGQALLLAQHVRKSDSFLSWSVGQRVLTLPAPSPTAAWQRDAVIVKLRFEREATITRNVETGAHS